MIHLFNKNILIISPEKWSELYVSKHHYARYLSKNNTVWFLNSIGNYSIKEGVKIIKHNDYNIHVINYRPIVRGVQKLPLFLLNILLKIEIARIKKKINKPIDIVWSFDPNRFWNLNYWKSQIKIYHAVDFHSKARFESITCETADIVIGVADLIISPLMKYNKNTYKINHGVDYDESQNINTSTEINLPGNNKIKAAYLGNLHRDVNYKLIDQLSKANENVDFILIGPYQGKKMGPSKISQVDFDLLSKNKNVFFIGEIKSYDILAYLAKININLLLFNDGAQVKHCNPHKLLFYLLSGKVIVSNIIDEYKNSDLLVMSKSLDLYGQEFNKVVNNLDFYNCDEIKSKRISFAKENTYKKQLERIEIIINRLNTGQL